MTFGEVEKVIGDKLPPSAFRWREWWANDASGHIQAQAWLSAGYRTARVDMERRRLVFERIDWKSATGRAASPGTSKPGTTTPRRHPAFGALKGTFGLAPDVDLAMPAFAEWADFAESAFESGAK